MKTLLRIVAIVAASLVVIGGAYAYVQSGGNTFLGAGPGFGERRTWPEGFGEGTRPQRGQDGQGQNVAPPDGQTFDGAMPPGFDGPEGFRRGGREGGGLFGLSEVIKNVLVMGVITLIVVAISVTWRFISRRLRRPEAAAPPAAS